jgi:hypothetical protein
MPPFSGGCVPVDGGPPCTTTTPAGGSPSGPGGGDSGGVDGGDLESGVLGCGSADGLLTIANTACGPCIQGGCCQADGACTGQCLQLLQCMLSCAQNNTYSATCTNGCADRYPDGVSAYNDFAGCLSNQCTYPECPMLPGS